MTEAEARVLLTLLDHQGAPPQWHLAYQSALRKLEVVAKGERACRDCDDAGIEVSYLGGMVCARHRRKNGSSGRGA